MNIATPTAATPNVYDSLPLPSRPDDLRPLVVASEELLQGRRELWIEHRGEMYRLRVTSAGKLYMTK